MISKPIHQQSWQVIAAFGKTDNKKLQIALQTAFIRHLQGDLYMVISKNHRLKP